MQTVRPGHFAQISEARSVGQHVTPLLVTGSWEHPYKNDMLGPVSVSTTVRIFIFSRQ